LLVEKQIGADLAKAMIVAGVMSGTSADGVDVALCRIWPGAREGDSPRVRLIGLLETWYPKAVRAAVLRVMEGEAQTAAEMSRLNWRLGELYADCVEKAAELFGVKVGLVGCHGQTVHHETRARRALGAAVRSAGRSTTWQMGEAAAVAERMRCPVVSDFRPADLAAGGEGAPLVPMLDYCLFRSERVNRVLLNLGGIANLTAIPGGGGLDAVMAFDTGPGNMVVDRCMASLFGKKYDRNGAVARRGRVLREVVVRAMRERYFAAAAPKSCGREEFGAGFAERLIGMCRDAGGTDADCVATATALTAESVVAAYRGFVVPHFETVGTEPMSQNRDPSTGSGQAMGHPVPWKTEIFVAGGGVRNGTLMAVLREGFAELGVRVRAMEELGVPAQAKEGVAFALLAWLTWNGRAGNVPAATGAKKAVVLGKVSFG
jgi:anhydro-N-acetylmuramic acid kinase